MDGIFCTGEPQLLVCAAPGFSFFFDFIEKLWSGDKAYSLHKICSLMRKLGVSHFCREELHLDGELLQERADLEICTEGEVEFSAVRISFFRHPNLAEQNWRQMRDGHFLGYVVIVTFKLAGKSSQSYIFEAVVRPPTLWMGHFEGQPVSNYYVRGQREFTTTIGAASDRLPLKLQGSFFCQQNGVTHVCAHAALRTAVNSSPTYLGSKVTSRRINDSLGLGYALGRRIGRDGRETGPMGLTPEQIEKVASDLGFRSHIADFTARPAIDYEDFIYPFVDLDSLQSSGSILRGLLMSSPWLAIPSTQIGGYRMRAKDTALYPTKLIPRWQPGPTTLLSATII